MKVTSKLVIMVLCAGLVQVTSAKNVSVTLVKEDPTMVIQYAVETVGNQPLQFKKMNNKTATIKFDDNSTIKNLHVKKAGDTNADAKKLALLDKKEQNNQQFDIIAIYSTGLPRYSTRADLEKFKSLKSKG